VNAEEYRGRTRRRNPGIVGSPELRGQEMNQRGTGDWRAEKPILCARDVIIGDFAQVGYADNTR